MLCAPLDWQYTEFPSSVMGTESYEKEYCEEIVNNWVKELKKTYAKLLKPSHKLLTLPTQNDINPNLHISSVPSKVLSNM